MIVRPGVEQIGGDGFARSQVPVWNPDTGVFEAGVSGAQNLVAAGTVRIDATDPANPIVRGAELLMQDGVTSPPVPIETEAGDDWLYQD